MMNTTQCNYSPEVHATAQLSLAGIITTVSIIINTLFSYGLYQTRTQTLSTADKLFITQAVCDAASCVLFLLPANVYAHLTNNFCKILPGWTRDDHILYQKTLNTLFIFPITATVLPGIISLVRYVKIVGRQTISSVILAGLISIISVSQIGIVMVQIVVMWVWGMNDLFKPLLIVVYICLGFILILLITINALLLHHVISNAMPASNRTHNNEEKLTVTILIVNACLIMTWLPDSICGAYELLIRFNVIPASAYTRVYIRYISGYLSLGVYINGATNGLIYMIRINRVKSFYKQKLCQLFKL